MSNTQPWTSHHIDDGGGLFEVLTRRTPRVTPSGALHLNEAPSAHRRSIAPGSFKVPGATERSRAADSRSDRPKTTRGHKPPMGMPSSTVVTPALRSPLNAGLQAPSLAFGDLPSVRAMGTGRPGIVVGFDTEFTNTTAQVRIVDSYQFAVPDPLNPTLMVEVVILPANGRRIGLHAALWTVVRAAGLWHSPLVHTAVDDRGVRRVDVLAQTHGAAGAAAQAWSADYRDWQARNTALTPFRVPIVLACHYGQADLTAFRGGRYVTDHLTYLTSAAGGLVTLQPFRLESGDGEGDWWRPLSVTVRDTMSHAPAGHKSLAALGASCGVPKLDVPDGWIANMAGYRNAHPTEFLDYGINDAVIVVEYLARVWGDGVVPPITLSGGAASALVSAGCEYFGLKSAKDFRLTLAGLVQEDGLEIVDDGDQLSFYAKRSRRPLDGVADQMTSAYARAYHGGLNSCPAPGFYPTPTVDVDAQNAYPTAMAALVDVDWEAGVVGEVVHERRLTQADVPSPTTPFVGFVSFTFPPSVAFPSLPIVADGTLVYPRTSDGTAGTWVCGPELWLALRLGAEVYCQIGFSARVLSLPDGSPSQVLRHCVKQFIDDRNLAKAQYGKGSIEELALKTGAASLYGKTAQDVVEHRAWNAYLQEMDSVGGSSITSPYHAATTTALVRAQLLATMNEIHEAGGQVFSVTTDGFITDMTVDEVGKLELYGLAAVLREARVALTGDSAIWEAKHHQNDLVNFATRGNVSLEPTGVCAHNGLKVPGDVKADSYEDRLHLLTQVVTRVGRVDNGYRRFPSFSELSRSAERKDFIPSWTEAPRSMDYDLKRRPVMSSMTAALVPLPDGSLHEVATFRTEPWETVEECVRARLLAKEQSRDGCLRTYDEWHRWALKFAHGPGRRIVTAQRTVLMSLVMAHRLGVVSIPTLADTSHTVTTKREWLTAWGLGTVSEGDWKNARKPERAAHILPLDALEPYLSRMCAMPSGTFPADADRLPY